MFDASEFKVSREKLPQEDIAVVDTATTCYGEENIAYDDMAIGRVIVKKSHRGQGISRIMMKKAIAFIIENLGKKRIRLSGQAYLTEFYEDLGFEKVSGLYLEDGIDHYEFLYEIE